MNASSLNIVDILGGLWVEIGAFVSFVQPIFTAVECISYSNVVAVAYDFANFHYDIKSISKKQQSRNLVRTSNTAVLLFEF